VNIGIGQAECGGVQARAGFLDPSADAIGVMVVADGYDGKRVHAVADNGSVIWTPHKDTDRIPPFIQVSGTLARPHGTDLFRAMSEAIALFLGERPEMSELRGRIAAQERHLEDVRALLWKAPKP